MNASTKNNVINAKYGQFERERRFLISELPKEMLFRFDIHDRYLPGSNLRLRKTTDGDGLQIWKLGQKIRINEEDPSEILHTSLYLKESEFTDLSAIAGNDLFKTRYQIIGYPDAMVLDRFHGDLEGLIMMEVDFGRSVDAMVKFAPPKFCSVEVTQDERFSGAKLATLSQKALQISLVKALGN